MPTTPNTPFDFAQVAHGLGELPAPEGRTYSAEDMTAMLSSITRWLAFGSDPGPLTGHNQSVACLLRVDTMAVRALALAWSVSPALFNGLSIRAVSELPHVLIAHGRISRHCRDLHERFGIASSAIVTDPHHLQALSESATERWTEAKQAGASAASPKS